MNDTGVKAALAAMGELIRNSVPDWIDAMRKRWVVAIDPLTVRWLPVSERFHPPDANIV